jgi:hypothetical protein
LYVFSLPQTSFTDVRDPSLKLAEFKLENIISTIKMNTDDSVFSSFSLKNCILDDKRPHVKKATPRCVLSFLLEKWLISFLELISKVAFHFLYTCEGSSKFQFN